jgi:hypothetical protein
VNTEHALDVYRGDLVAAAIRWNAGRRRRRRNVLAVTGAAALLTGVLAATPARALVLDVLPFWNQPAAPQPVKLEFSVLNTYAPAGMSPRADSANTREVMQAEFGGKTHTLYVSPAKGGGYCELWTDASGGCNTAGEPLTWGGVIAPPHDADQPAETVIPQGEMTALTQTGVALWITGDVMSARVDSVVIRFSDGSSVEPPLTWVSAPIAAGFFAYDVPNDEQSAADHVTEIDAYDANGNLVRSDPIHPGG